MLSASFLTPAETKIMVLLPASIERFGVSCMRDEKNSTYLIVVFAVNVFFITYNFKRRIFVAPLITSSFQILYNSIYREITFLQSTKYMKKKNIFLIQINYHILIPFAIFWFCTLGFIYIFSKHRPSGPMLSISRHVRPSVCTRLD